MSVGMVGLLLLWEVVVGGGCVIVVDMLACTMVGLGG